MTSFDKIDLNKIEFSVSADNAYGGRNLEIKYDAGKGPKDLIVKFPVLQGYKGIEEKEFKGEGMSDSSGKVTRSIHTLFPIDKPTFTQDENGDVIMTTPKEIDDGEGNMVDNYDETAQKAVEFIDTIYRMALKFIENGVNGHADKETVRRLRLSFNTKSISQETLETMVKNPIYRRPISEEDDTPDPNAAPSVFLKLIESGPNHKTNPNHVYTKFFGLDGKEMDWRDLINKAIFFDPTVQIYSIYLGANKGMQFKISRAIVYQVREMTRFGDIEDELKEIAAANPEAVKAFIASQRKSTAPVSEEGVSQRKQSTPSRVSEDEAIKKATKPRVVAKPVVPENEDSASVEEDEESGNVGESPGLTEFMAKSVPPPRRTVVRSRK